MNLLSEVVYKTRYSRFLPEKSRREHWPETVARYVDYMEKQCLEHGYSLTAGERTLIIESIQNMEVMPSMRALMTAGKALDVDHVAGYNPVAGHTKVLTREAGLVPIQTLAGTKKTVLNVNGVWTEALFRSYGLQKTVTARFKLNSNTVQDVECTHNHRWVLDTGEVVPTSSLEIGNHVKFVSAPREVNEDNIDYSLGVKHGIVYGDGTATYAQKRHKGYHIRVCSDHKDILKWFDGCTVSYPPTYKGDPVVMLYDDFAKTHTLKELPSNDETEEYLIGFFRGWLAADGHVTKGGQIGLACGKSEIAWLEAVGERLGYVIQSKNQLAKTTNFGLRKKPLWNVYFSRSSFTADDLIIERKRTRFKPLHSKYVFSGFVGEETTQEVFCAEVPDTNTFVLEKGLVTGNCAYLEVTKPKDFAETLYILMNGTGVGFSCERDAINKLPDVPTAFIDSSEVVVVEDSKLGWAEAYYAYLKALYEGLVPKVDYSKVRPAGARLKTFGGRASGPEPLKKLLDFTLATFKGAAGRKLQSIEVHDIMCTIGEVVVVGGVRRSALISLSNFSDLRMREAKVGAWWENNKQRALANNSVAYTEKPDVEAYIEEFFSLIKSKSGERGIFNRVAARRQATRFGRRRADVKYGCNPCSEIILRPKQFCNL